MFENFTRIFEGEFDGSVILDVEAQTAAFHMAYQYSLMDTPPTIPFRGRMICTDLFDFIMRDQFVAGLMVAIQTFFPECQDVEHVSEVEFIGNFDLFRCKDLLFVVDTQDAGYFHNISMIGPIDMGGIHLPAVGTFENQETNCDLIVLYNELIRMRRVELQRRDEIVSAVGDSLIEAAPSFKEIGCIGPDNLALVLRMMAWDD